MKFVLNPWILIGLSFLVYFCISYCYKLISINNFAEALIAKNGLELINIKHFIGILLFGILFYPTFPEFEFLLESFTLPNLEIFTLFIVVLGLSLYASLKFIKRFKSNNKEFYSCKSPYISNYFLLRIMFLLFYEFFFRGILLFSFLEIYNPVLAIGLSTVLYVLIHCFDSKSEIIGSIPFGIILCLITYHTGNIWSAFAVHIALSIIYEMSVYFFITSKSKLL